ncbi:MAG: virulence factor BrkB family protein [Gammaproteobacteria bacterium]
MLPLIQTGSQIVQIVISVVKRFEQDRCFRVASALAFTTLLALVPLVTVIFSMLSLFPVFEQWSDELEAFLFKNFVPAAGDAVQAYLLEFSSQAGKLTAVGLIFLLLSTLLLLATIEDAFNDIWRVQRGRVLFQRLLVYWAVVTLGPLLTAVSLSMSSALLSLTIFSDQSLIAGVTRTLLRYLPLLFELGAYLLFYKAIPNTEVKLRHAFMGALVATILFELAKLGFAFYILNFKSYQLIYGALATIPIFFIWVYLSWLVMLIGAVIAAELKSREQLQVPSSPVIEP